MPIVVSRPSLFLLLTVLGLSPALAGPSPEALKAGAWDSALAGGALLKGAGTWTSTVAGVPLGVQPAAAPLLLDAAEELTQAGPAASLVKTIDLSALLNRHLKSRLRYTLGGAAVWVSGVFDRKKDAWVSLLEDGKDPVFYNVMGLLSGPEVVPLGSANYVLSLAPNITDQIRSEVLLTNAKNKKEQVRIVLKDLIAAVSAAGDGVRVAGEDYRVFYYDDLDGGAQTKAKQTLVFMLTDSQGEFHIFLIPAENIPSGKVAVFKMLHDRRVGLQRDGDQLKVYDNP